MRETKIAAREFRRNQEQVESIAVPDSATSFRAHFDRTQNDALPKEHCARFHAYVSYDRGASWALAVGTDVPGGAHVRKDGKVATETSIMAPLRPGRGRLLRLLVRGLRDCHSKVDLEFL